METDNFIQEIRDALYEVGEPSKYGCDENQLNQMVKYARTLGKKPHCAISEWGIWYVFESIADATQGWKPEYTLVHSEKVLYDERPHWNNHTSIRSSRLIKIHHDCIFETKNTFYILVGNGTEKPISSEVAASIYFYRA